MNFIDERQEGIPIHVMLLKERQLRKGLRFHRAQHCEEVFSSVPNIKILQIGFLSPSSPSIKGLQIFILTISHNSSPTIWYR